MTYIEEAPSNRKITRGSAEMSEASSARDWPTLPRLVPSDKPFNMSEPVACYTVFPVGRRTVRRKTAIKDGAERSAWNQMARGRTGRVRRERESGLIARCRYVSAVSMMGLRVRADRRQGLPKRGEPLSLQGSRDWADMWLSVRSMLLEDRQRWRWEVHSSPDGEHFSIIAHGTWCDWKRDAVSEGRLVAKALQLLDLCS